MRIIIIGASGLIGNELYQICKSQDIACIGTSTHNPKECLVSFDMQKQSIQDIVPDLNQEDVIVLLSAYSNPSWIFTHQEEAIDLNRTATLKLIDSLPTQRIVFMSSVEVFDGKKGNYIEKTPPNPLNLYGKMKAEVEAHLIHRGGNFCIVRTGWNVGWTLKKRCVITLTYETLLQDNAKMATDNIFSISDAHETALGLLKLCQESDVQYCHLASQPAITRIQLADLIIQKSLRGKEMAYTPCLFSEIPYSEPRARENHLNTDFAQNKLGLKFTDPLDIIERKLDFLDKNLNN